MESNLRNAKRRTFTLKKKTTSSLSGVRASSQEMTMKPLVKEVVESVRETISNVIQRNSQTPDLILEKKRDKDFKSLSCVQGVVLTDLTIDQKIEKCVDIWIEKESLQPSQRKAKFSDILGKIQDGIYKEKDLDVFIDGWQSGKYN